MGDGRSPSAGGGSRVASTEMADRTPRSERDERLGFLARASVFRQLPETVLRDIAALAHIRRLSRGEFVFLEGEPATTLSLLVAGRVKLVRETEDGREVILRLLRPGEIFGGAGVWGESSYPATAIAQDNAVVLQLPVNALQTLLATHPELGLAIIRVLAARLHEAEARIRDLQTERVERRIARVLLRLANKTGRRTAHGIDIGVPLSRQDLAELSGTTLSTASRTLSAWNQRGIVAAARERVTILDSHRLVALAEDLPVPDDRPNESVSG